MSLSLPPSLREGGADMETKGGFEHPERVFIRGSNISNANEPCAMVTDAWKQTLTKSRKGALLTWPETVATVFGITSSYLLVRRDFSQHTSGGSRKIEQTQGIEIPLRGGGDMNELCPFLTHEGLMSAWNHTLTKRLRGHLLTCDEKVAIVLALVSSRTLADVSSYSSLEKEKQLQIEWEEKVVSVLHIMRRQQLTEFDPNKAIAGLGPPIRKIVSFDSRDLYPSLNVISIRVIETHEEYPFSIFGSVLARDQLDYRCVYLYRRGRADPQVLSSKDDVLTLTGPNRGLGSFDSIYFEVNLKIIRVGGIVEDFSKGVIKYDTYCQRNKVLRRWLPSWLSTVEFVCTPVKSAMEATIAVNVLEGPRSTFSGIISACTTGNDENDIILYDNEVRGTQITLGDGGSIELTRRLVVVPFDEELMIDVSVYEGESKAEFFSFILGHNDEVCSRRLGRYELQVKVIWTCCLRRRRKMFEIIGETQLLW